MVAALCAMEHPLGRPAPPRVHIGVMLPDPVVSDRVCVRARGVRVLFLRTPQPFLKPFLVLRVPQTLPAATMICLAIHLAIRPTWIPEWEAAVYTEAIGVSRDKRPGLRRRHGLIQNPIGCAGTPPDMTRGNAPRMDLWCLVLARRRGP